MASKAAVEAMTKILAKEMKGTGITVNCVAPGPIATEMFFEGKTPERIQAAIEECPHGRLGKVEDVAPERKNFLEIFLSNFSISPDLFISPSPSTSSLSLSSSRPHTPNPETLNPGNPNSFPWLELRERERGEGAPAIDGNGINGGGSRSGWCGIENLKLAKPRPKPLTGTADLSSEEEEGERRHGGGCSCSLPAVLRKMTMEVESQSRSTGRRGQATTGEGEIVRAWVWGVELGFGVIKKNTKNLRNKKM